MIPCEECIGFVMCKQRIKKLRRPDITQFSSVINCDRLKKHVRNINRNYDFYNEENSNKELIPINKVRTLFGLHKIVKNRGYNEPSDAM